ncbi:MAG: hypothetical protein LBU79_00835, partial [Planctomycetota bacterium]|nr:hypothetical protein [Planctomycetota bacterium]
MIAFLPRPSYLTRILGVALMVVFVTTVAKSADVDIGTGETYTTLNDAFIASAVVDGDNLILHDAIDNSLQSQSITDALTNIGIASDGTTRTLRNTSGVGDLGGIFSITGTTPLHMYLKDLIITLSEVNGLTSHGGAIYSDGRDLDFTGSLDVLFSNNTAIKGTAGSASTALAGQGGAIYAIGSVSFQGVSNIDF